MPRLTNGLEQVLTNLGIVGDGYKLYFFQTGTSTPKTSYTTEDLNIANTNPVVLNAAGRPDTGIWGSDPSLYRMVLGTPSSTISTVLASPVVDVDPVDVTTTNNIAGLTPIPTAYWGATTGTSTHYVLNPALVDITSYSNTQTFYIDFNIACGASPDIDINGLGTLNLKKYTGQGTKVALGTGDVQVQRYECINDGVDIVILNPEHPANLPANTTTWRGLTYLPSPITIANNVSDANNDIDFSAGVFQFSDGSGQAIAAAITKRLDAAWAAGTGNGGLFSGTKANSTWYDCFEISNSDGSLVDAGFDTSIVAANIPSGYTKYKRVGTIRTNGSGNILGFIQFGNYFGFKTALADINAVNPGTSAVSRTLTVPPNTIANVVLSIIDITFGGTSIKAVLSNLDGTDLDPNTFYQVSGRAAVGSSVDSSSTVQVQVNSSSQVRSRINVSDGDISIIVSTYGFTDNI